jgi:hypothetical protein
MSKSASIGATPHKTQAGMNLCVLGAGTLSDDCFLGTSKPLCIQIPERSMTDEEMRELSKEAAIECNEILGWNALYGHDFILKQYAKYPGPLDGIVPHGVYSPFVGISGMEVDTGLHNVYNWLSYFDETYKANDLNVIPFASPFLYALTMMGFDGLNKGEGTLFVPYHSTDVWDFDDSWYDMARMVRSENLPGPIGVLLFFEDVKKGRCGDKFRPDFLFRFAEIVSKYKYVATNGISTPAFYAAAMGRPVSLIGDIPRYRDGIAPWPFPRPFPEDIYKVFATHDEAQQEAWRVILRADEYESPDSMRAKFESKKPREISCTSQEQHTAKCSESFAKVDVADAIGIKLPG